MAEIEVKRKDGQAAGKVSISEKLAGAPIKSVSIHRAVVAEESNARQGTQQTKSRSTVNGGGRKPYKQKKTGNARQGSTRSPQYAHGAMALPLTPRDYLKKVNRKERRAAIVGALSAQIEAGNVQVVEEIVFAEPKTKQAVDLLTALGVDGIRRVLIILPVYDLVTYKSFRNLPNVTVRTAPSSGANGSETAKTVTFSARDILVAHKIVVAKEALAKIEEVWVK